MPARGPDAAGATPNCKYHQSTIVLIILPKTVGEGLLHRWALAADPATDREQPIAGAAPDKTGFAEPTGCQFLGRSIRPPRSTGVLGVDWITDKLLWGAKARDKGEPVRVEKAFPAIVSKAQFRRVNQFMHSRVPKVRHPRRVGSSYLLSGLIRCQACDTSLIGRFAQSGKYAYYTSARPTSSWARTPARLPASTPDVSRNWSSTRFAPTSTPRATSAPW